MLNSDDTNPSPTIVDAFATPVFWSREEAPSYVVEAVEGVFGPSADVFRPRSPAELVAEMDEAGVGRAILNAVEGTVEEVAGFVEAYPERFLLGAEVDPTHGMRSVRLVESLVAEHGVCLVRMIPFRIGLPPNDRAYYPIYAKCIELGVAVSVTTGMPGPPLPAEPQRPLHLDDVCRDWPELVMLMAHGADPWWPEAIRLLGKYKNLYLITSDWSPKRLPEELVRFMDRRGRGKILFGSGYPVLSMARCAGEAVALPLAPEALSAYLGGAAGEIFNGARVDAADKNAI